MALSAQYYADVFNGNVFIGSTASAGVKPPATNATAITYAVWNPLGSGKNIIPLFCNVGFVDTTSAASNLGLSYQTGMGSQVATGASVTAATLVAPVNALLSAGNASISKFAPATLTLAAAASYLMTFGWTTGPNVATDHPFSYVYQYVFNGQLIVAPGSGIFVTSANTAVLSNLDITTVWAEINSVTG